MPADGQGPSRGETDPPASRPAPYLLLAGVLLVLVPVRAAIGPIRDIDLYWHLLVGRDLLHGVAPAQAGRGWSFAPVADTWVSTQWLAEAAFAQLELWGGLPALVLLRTLTVVAALAVLACVTLVRRPVRSGIWPFTIGALAISMSAEERSQQVTFILAPLVGWWLERLVREGRVPRAWVLLPLVVVWANVHGGWVLLPIALTLGALARVLDHGWRDRSAAAALMLAIGCTAMATISPSGLENITAVRRFAASTAIVLEWQRVSLDDVTVIPLVLIAATIIVAWARGRARPSRGEIVVVGVLLVFATLAWRNVTPSVLALTPIATGILSRALGEPDPSRERPALARTTIALGAFGAVVGIVVSLAPQQVVDRSVPLGLLHTLAETTSEQRVLDNYNVSGPLLWFAGPPPHVVVGVDGRADRYGPAYLDRYLDTLAARAGWEVQVDALAPTAALLHRDDALVGVLVAQRHWVEVGREADYVLLHAPDAPGWPSA